MALVENAHAQVPAPLVPAAAEATLASPEDPSRDPDHEARVVAALARATREIPFYSERASLPGGSLSSALASAPLLTKAAVRRALPKQWVPASVDVKQALAAGDIELVETSGSTGERLRILWDRGWWLRQEGRAMRVNARVADAHAGAFGPYREAILTTPVCGPASCHVGDLPFEDRIDEHRLFLNTRADPTFWGDADMTRMLDELEAHGTVGLESDPVYLATLARHAFRLGRTLAVSGFTQLTYAFTARGHLASIRRAYQGPLLQLYGASEVGVLFMEGGDGLLHHAPFTTHVELLPVKVATPGAENVALVVVTTLDRQVQPLVRFVVGDLVQVKPGGPRLFTTVRPLASVEGRVQDALVRPDGALITCGALDRAVGEQAKLFQIDQPTATSVVANVVPGDDGPAGASLERAIEARLAPLCAGMNVKARATTAIAAEASGKFRLVRRQVPLDWGRTFEGCAGLALS